MFRCILRRLLLALLCVGLLCSCSAVPEEQSGPIAHKTKRPEEPSPPPIECKWIETTAEIPPGNPELNGRLWNGTMPEGIDWRNRLYFSGQGVIHLIDLDGNLVRWGRNWDNFDAGWNEEDGIQTFEQRNVLMKGAQKMARSFLATFVLDSNQDLWGWGSDLSLLLYDGDSHHPPREPVKVLSEVKDVEGADFYAAVVRTDGRLQFWNKSAGYPEPVTIRTGVEKICSLNQMMFIDQQHRLYCYPDGWSNHQEPVLLDTDVEDVGFPAWNIFLVLKTNGTVELTRYFGDRIIILAEDCVQLAGSGYITEDGTFWHCRLEEPRPIAGTGYITNLSFRKNQKGQEWKLHEKCSYDFMRQSRGSSAAAG